MSESQTDWCRQQYACLDSVLQYISANFVSIDKLEEKRHKDHLNFVFEELLDRMKKEDSLFGRLFLKTQVSGSFWDGLKVGKPDEFDLNVVLKLPNILRKRVTLSQVEPGFVTVNIHKGFEELSSDYRKLEGWVDDKKNMIADKVRSWMESIVDKVIKKLPVDGRKFFIRNGNCIYSLRTRKMGPATTISVDVDDLHFTIDLVPALEFGEKELPASFAHHVNAKLFEKNRDWHVVPKPIKPGESENISVPPFLLWRLCFQNQESVLIHDTYHLKAALKLMKKLRDTKLDQNLISSYAIKTVFMLEMERQKVEFWNQQLSFVFIYMLKVLIKRLRDGNIPFYWDRDCNLLKKLSRPQIEQCCGAMENSLSKLSAGVLAEDSDRIASVILQGEELQIFKEDFQC